MADKILDVDLQAAEDARVMRVLKRFEKEKLKQRVALGIFFIAGALIGHAYTILTLGSETLR